MATGPLVTKGIGFAPASLLMTGGLGTFAVPVPIVIDPSLAVMGLPVMGAPDYVAPTDPLIELYRDRGDVDIIHLVVVRPYVPSGNG